MEITIFGATGQVGQQCLTQAILEGHRVTVLVRSAQKLRALLPVSILQNVAIVEGDALNEHDVQQSITPLTQAIFFTIGVDKNSPNNLCTNITKNILKAIGEAKIRFIFCGGGSTFLKEDKLTLGAHFVRLFASTFFKKKHLDKEHQMQLLLSTQELIWLGIRPLKIVNGPKTANYKLGFNSFGPASKINHSDCAHAMLCMLTENEWLNQAPIIQYN